MIKFIFSGAPAVPGQQAVVETRSEAYPTAWSEYDAEPERPGTSLSHYLWVLKHHRWTILLFVLGCVAVTAVVSWRITPVYESTSIVDIDRQMPTSIIGQDSVRIPVNDADQFIATQVRLIESDSVLRPVAQQYHLVDRQGKKPSDAEQNAPVILKHLKVTRTPNTYLLLISYRCTDARLAADVANAIARSYVEHTYNIRFRSSSALSTFMEKQLEELKAKMERSSTALAQFERELNVINPEEKTSILSARLLQLNTEYTNAQTDRVRKESAWAAVRGGSLEAAQVSSQGEDLKTLTSRLDEARQKFADVKTHYGANHPEYRKAATQVEEIERQLREKRENIAGRVEVEYLEALDRESMLRKAVAQTKDEFDRLNARSFEYQSLKREAEADKNLYEELVRKIKEASINAGFQNSSIRLADAARPAFKPVFPNMPLNIVLAFLFSTLMGVGAAILSDVLDSSVRNPQQVASLCQTEVLGSLPMVKSWRRGLQPVQVILPAPLPSITGATGEANPVALWQPGKTVADNPVIGFEEAVGTLRNSILLGSRHRRLKSIMITSCVPAEGKTTTAVHLAIAHARQNHKTLLLDCDLRRPGVHKKLGINLESGAATVLQNGHPWREKLAHIADLPELDILPTAHTNQRAGLIGATLPRILEEAAADYDLIVVDAPPILGFSEPLQMAAAVDGVVVVALAGRTDRGALGAAISALQRIRANVVGLVLNEVTRDTSDVFRYYGYDSKYYKYYKAAG